MAECGFQKKECNDKCALFLKGTKECAVVTLTVLMEGIHNMCVIAHDKYLKEDPYDSFEEDPLAKAMLGMAEGSSDDDEEDDAGEDEKGNSKK